MQARETLKGNVAFDFDLSPPISHVGLVSIQYRSKRDHWS